MPIVLAVIVVAGMIALAVYLYRQEQERQRLLRQWAAEQQFTFAAERDTNLASRLDDFGILNRGRSRYAKNVMTGNHDRRPVWAFDYFYTTGSGRNTRRHRLSVVVIKCAHPLIPLTIRREHLFDRVGEFIGIDDIDFESAEFSRRFCVKSPDRRWAYDVIHGKMMEYLLEHGNATVEFGNWHVIAYRNRRFSPAEFASAIGLIEGILSRIPAYVIRQLTGQDGTEPETAQPDSAQPDRQRPGAEAASARRRRS